MSVINDTTQALGLPLPHPQNKLQDDVLRVRQALHAIDGLLLGLQETVIQKAQSDETWQALEGLGEALAAIDLAVSALGTGKVASVNGVSGVNITLTPAHLSLGPTNGPANSAFTYDAKGRITQMTQSIQGHNATTAYSYDGQGRLTQMQTAYRGQIRKEVISYSEAGLVMDIAATEQGAA